MGACLALALVGACTSARQAVRPQPEISISRPPERSSPPPAEAEGTRCRPPAPRSTHNVTIHLVHEGRSYSDAVAVQRPVAPGSLQAPLLATLRELTRGTTEREQRRGCSSYFDSTKPGVLLGVGLDDGRATIDFRGDAMFALGATEAAANFFAQLIPTVFAFPEIDSIRLELDGSCKKFGVEVQSLRCETIRRSEL